MDTVRCVKENEAAEMLGISIDALRDLRKKSKIKYVRISERRIRYNIADLRAFVEKRTMMITQ